MHHLLTVAAKWVQVTTQDLTPFEASRAPFACIRIGFSLNAIIIIICFIMYYTLRLATMNNWFADGRLRTVQSHYLLTKEMEFFVYLNGLKFAFGWYHIAATAAFDYSRCPAMHGTSIRTLSSN